MRLSARLGNRLASQGWWHIRREGGSTKALEIRAAEFMTSDVGDAPMLPELLDQIHADQEISSVTAPSHGLLANHERGRPRCRRDYTAPQERIAVEARHPWGDRTKRGIAYIEALRPDNMATRERLSPQEPRRDMRRIRKRSGGSFSRRLDALYESARPAHHGTALRPSSGRVPCPCGRPERLHRTWHTRQRSRGLNPSGERETAPVNRFVQHKLCPDIMQRVRLEVIAVNNPVDVWG